MDHGRGNASLESQDCTKLQPEARLKYGRCEGEHLLFWLSGHPTTSTEYTYSQIEDQTEAHTITQMSQIIRRESSPFDLGGLKLPYEIEPFLEIDEDLGIPMPSADTKERVCGRATPATPYSGMSSNSPSEVARRLAAIPKVLNHDYEPSQEPNQPPDAMRAFFAKPMIKLLTEAAENGLAGSPEGYHRSHAVWLTRSLPLAIESKEVSDPHDMEAAIDAFKRECRDEIILMRRKCKRPYTLARRPCVLMSSKHQQASFRMRHTRRTYSGLSAGSRIGETCSILTHKRCESLLIRRKCTSLLVRRLRRAMMGGGFFIVLWTRTSCLLGSYC